MQKSVIFLKKNFINLIIVRIDKNGEELTKNISYILQFIQGFKN